MSKIHICNNERFTKNPKARDFTFYLDEIDEMGRKFEKLEAISTEGSPMAPFPYQWRAVSDRLEGEDDPYEGLGKTPIEAVINLYREIKHAIKNYNPEDEE